MAHPERLGRNAVLALACYIFASQLQAADKLPVRLTVSPSTPGRVVVDIVNDMNVTATISAEIGGLRLRSTVPAHSSLSQVLLSASTTVRWSAAPAQGTPDILDYRLPFKGSAVVSQTPDCLSTHDWTARHAVDFALPEGTPIVGAREGTVFEPSPAGRGNRGSGGSTVHILHADGSWATYAHLQAAGILVAPGQYVGKGELLGYAGSTGTSSGPHLHFSVSYLRQGQVETLPVTFDAATACGSHIDSK